MSNEFTFFSQKFRNWGFYFYFKLYAWSKLLILFKAIALLWTFIAPVSDFYTLIFLSTSSFLMMSDVGIWLWKCSFDSKIKLRWAWLNPLITSIQSVLAVSVCYCQSLNVCSVTSYPWEWKEKESKWETMVRKCEEGARLAGGRREFTSLKWFQGRGKNKIDGCEKGQRWIVLVLDFSFSDPLSHSIWNGKKGWKVNGWKVVLKRKGDEVVHITILIYLIIY